MTAPTDPATWRALVRRAYALLGRRSEAEELVQEAYLRLHTQDPPPERPVGWLTTVLTRLALDAMKSARARREVYPGPTMPDPLPLDPADPEVDLVLAEGLSMATLAVLERLSEAERAAWVLRELFDQPYEAIGQLLGKQPAAVRQLVRRARAHLAEARPRFEVAREEHTALLFGLAAALQSGEASAVQSLLAPNLTLISDGGGKATAAGVPIVGAARVARFLLSVQDPTLRPELVRLNAQPSVLFWSDEVLHSALVFTVYAGQVHGLHILRHPDRLASLAQALRST